MSSKILGCFFIILLSTSCGILVEPSREQTANEYMKSIMTDEDLRNERKWELLADALGVDAERPSPARLVESLKKPSTLMGPNTWQDNLLKYAENYWDKTAEDPIILKAARIAQAKKTIKLDEEGAKKLFKASKLYAEKLVLLRDQIKTNNKIHLYTLKYEVLGRNYYAYVSIPKNYGKKPETPLLYLHKDDVGLSWDLMKKDLGSKILEEKIVIAPAGAEEGICGDYTEREESKEPLFPKNPKELNKNDVAAWDADVNNAIALMRGLSNKKNLIKSSKDETTNLREEHFLQKTKEEYLSTRIFDVLGLSKGGLTGFLVAAKIGYINKASLLSYLTMQGIKKAMGLTGDEADNAFRRRTNENDLVFVRSLVSVSAPLTFIHGGFRTVVSDCAKGLIGKSEYKDYPGLRHITGLFDAFRKADDNTPKEKEELEKLRSEVLIRDPMFLAPLLSGSMPSVYFVRMGLKPKLAFFHHKNDSFIPATNNLFMQTMFTDPKVGFRETMKKTLLWEYDIEMNNVFKTGKETKNSDAFHLKRKFWSKLSSQNKANLDPRAAIYKALSM